MAKLALGRAEERVDKGHGAGVAAADEKCLRTRAAGRQLRLAVEQRDDAFEEPARVADGEAAGGYVVLCVCVVAGGRAEEIGVRSADGVFAGVA